MVEVEEGIATEVLILEMAGVKGVVGEVEGVVMLLLILLLRRRGRGMKGIRAHPLDEGKKGGRTQSQS